MTKIFNRISEKVKRKTLRNNMPQAEVSLWTKLKNKGLKGYKFRRQYSVGKFVIDFYCPKLKLAIEIDGDSHFAEGADIYDSDRQKIIESFGITFLRFTNREIYENIENVLENIAKHIRPSLTPPYIPPLGKGRLVGHIPPLGKGRLVGHIPPLSKGRLGGHIPPLGKGRLGGVERGVFNHPLPLLSKDGIKGRFISKGGINPSVSPLSKGGIKRGVNNERGFTLLELMIVVAIIIVLIGIAGATWLLSLNHLSLRNDARDIASALRRAKQLAITTSRPHQVYLDVNNEVSEIEDCNLGTNDPPNECNAAAATYFSGSGATHGTVVGSLRDLRITSFGHKNINIATMVCTAAGHGNPPINQVVFNTDGTASFFNNGGRHETTQVTITLARTDGNAETKTIEINNMGRVNVP